MQRDILPIVEGTTVNTRYGMVRTDHILFIAAGAFHVSKPRDLIPELQGRFPIRVELQSLTMEDFIRILTEPKNPLGEAVRGLAGNRRCEAGIHGRGREGNRPFAALVNEGTENIGARRLHTIMERLLDEISFEGPDLKKKTIRSMRPTFRRCWNNRQGSGSQPVHSINAHLTRALGGIQMKDTYSAVIKQSGSWWIGWIEEVPGVNCQEPTRQELIESLKVTLQEALEFNRREAREAAGQDFEEASIAV